jgi:hypothetical protein
MLVNSGCSPEAELELLNGAEWSEFKHRLIRDVAWMGVVSKPYSSSLSL